MKRFRGLSSTLQRLWNHPTEDQFLYAAAMIEANHEAACLNHINGLYGPGAMLGWYLTLAGCIISWTIHPRRRSTDSIHPDFVAFLIVPLAAAAQAISTSRLVREHLVTVDGDMEALKRNYASLQTCQTRAAIETSSKVVLLYLFITIMIYPLSALRRFKRASALASVFIICFASQCYALDSTLFNTPAVVEPSNSYRFFGACAGIIGTDIAKLIEHRFESRRAKGPGTVESQTSTKPDSADLWDMRSIALLSIIIGTLTNETKVWWITLFTLRGHTWRELFPETPYSLGNIEQAMAAASGAIALGFNLYSVGVLWYKERKASVSLQKSNERPETPERELRRWHGQEDDARD